ncbi:TPA: hypothetical protein ENS27_15920 [bacterium]|nr:hypothetical protein [bacterium]
MLRSSTLSYNDRKQDMASLFEEIVILLILIAIASVLRFWKLGEWSFWADEIFSVQDAQNFPESLTINPIIYAIIHWTTNTFGLNEWSARLGPCIIGIISLPFIYLIARRMFSAQVGVVSSLFLVFHPWHIYWSQNARAYSLVFFLAGISAYCFYEAIESNKLRYSILSLLLTMLSIASYLHCVLILPAFIIYVIILPFLPITLPKGLNKRILLTFFVPFILSLSVLFIPTVREYIYSGWGSNEWGRNALYILFTVGYSLGIPFTVASIIGIFHSFAYLNRGGIFLMCYAIVPLLCLLAISPFLNVAGYYLFFTMPAYLILAGLCASEAISFMARDSKVLSSAVVLILLIFLISQSYLYFFVENGGREKWKEAFQSISGKVEIDDTVVVPMPRVAEYYLQKQNLQQLEKVINSIEQSQNQWNENKQDVWFVIDEPSVQVLDPQHKFQDWLYTNCRLVKEFPVYARVMDRTVRIWYLDYIEPISETKQPNNNIEQSN